MALAAEVRVLRRARLKSAIIAALNLCSTAAILRMATPVGTNVGLPREKLDGMFLNGSQSVA